MNKSTKTLGFRCVLLLAMTVGINHQAYGLATEEIGNKPLYESNYKDFKGIMPVINHKSRVYQFWCNGNEYFYYRGDTKALNDALRKFAASEADVREVIIRPGPGETTTFNAVRVPYDWNLHIVGGIARHHVSSEKDNNIWDKYPTLTVFVNGGNIELEKIKIPKGITVIEIADLRMRYLMGLQSYDREKKSVMDLESVNHEVRGYSAYFLA
ncbi:MAG: hypothetical protein ACYTBZ_01590 [Planctomycetota bacterium]|jgi:hypothetical protein